VPQAELKKKILLYLWITLFILLEAKKEFSTIVLRNFKKGMLSSRAWISEEDSSWCEELFNTVFLIFSQIPSNRKTSVCMATDSFSTLQNHPCVPNSTFFLPAHSENPVAKYISLAM